MFVAMRSSASEVEILGVKSRILAEGLTPFEHRGANGVVVAVVGEVGSRRPALLETLAELPGVARVTPIAKPYKLTSREFHPEDTVIEVHGTVVGDGSLTVMAGPCSVESRKQLIETAEAVAEAGATVLRGGAFKPRTSPYSFQGLGVEALRYLAEARDRTGLPVITEAMEPAQVDIVAEYADILQIGARNMQNYSLLNAAGRVARPVMLKRGFGATIEELLMAAEYIVAAGNPNVILCERGIRTFELSTRNTMDLSAVPVLHQLTHLPVVVDPSHATGKRQLVPPLAMGGVAVGADGVMVEVHPQPDAALSDPEQQLDLDGFRELMGALRPIHEHVRGYRRDGGTGAQAVGRSAAGAGAATGDGGAPLDGRELAPARH
jgi:3-deoxy-7-phosphoheptulonate synthase